MDPRMTKEAFEKESRNYLPSGPYIPVKEIPNEIRRLFLNKKAKFAPTYPYPVASVDDIRSLTLLTQISLAIFICLCVLLIFLLIGICCLQITRTCRKRNKNRKRVPIPTEHFSPAAIMTVQAHPTFEKQERQQAAPDHNRHEPLFAKCSVRSTSGSCLPTAPRSVPSSSTSTDSFEMKGGYQYNVTAAREVPKIDVTRAESRAEELASHVRDTNEKDLSLNRSYSVYEEMASPPPPLNDYYKTSSNSSFDSYPEDASTLAVVNRQRSLQKKTKF